MVVEVTQILLRFLSHLFSLFFFFFLIFFFSYLGIIIEFRQEVLFFKSQSTKIFQSVCFNALFIYFSSFYSLYFIEIVKQFWKETKQEQQTIQDEEKETENKQEQLQQNEESHEKGEGRVEFDWERAPGWKGKEKQGGKKKKKEKEREGRVLMTKKNREKLVSLLQVCLRDESYFFLIFNFFFIFFLFFFFHRGQMNEKTLDQCKKKNQRI